MRLWLVSAAILFVLSVPPAGRAQTCALVEVVQPGDCFRYGIEMKLTGELRFQKESGPTSVKLNATANHVYSERALVGSGGIIQKSARTYETARLNIERNGDRSTLSLRPARKLVVAQRHKDQLLTYSPAGAFYRSELDLVGGHFDTLALAGLLSGKTMKVGETWKLPNLVAQALCGLEGITENKLEAKLEKVAEDVAMVAITGSAAGVESGALVKLTAEAAATYDLKAKRLTRVVWKQKTDRDQGPVSPASTLEVLVTLERKAIAQPAELADAELVSIPEGFAPPGPMTNLEHRDARERFALIHPRDWHLTAISGDHTILRLMDRGDYIAQVTVTPWTRAKKGEHLSAEQFKNAMRSTSGWRPEKELQSGEVPTMEGKYIYRLSEQGYLDGVQVLQNFFLVASPDGDQVVLTFTLSPKLADKLGARDLSMAASIEVPAAPEKK
ncbi:MAG: hypothetical protein U0840_26055 [Gemmataceae bacterium]